MTTTADAPADHNSLGKGAFIIGLVGLVLAFVPVIGFASWLLGPLAVLCGAIALRKPRRSLAIAGLITGALTIMVCFWWINATKAVGEAMSKDTFNTTGKVADLAAAPIMDASIKGLWKEIEDNKVAAGTKYGGKRLRFTEEKIEDFEGDATDPRLQFVGKTDDYLIHMVGASFLTADGAKIGALKKGEKVTFVCEAIKESFGDGYGLGGCKLQ